MSRNDPFYSPEMTIPDMLRHGGVQRLPTPRFAEMPPNAAGLSPEADYAVNEIVASLTTPGGRPEVYLRSLNYGLSVGTTPVALVNNRISVDTVVIDVPSTALNSVFFGYGGGISTGSAIEVRAGIPLIWQPDNTREQWELQRVLEYMAAILGGQAGIPPLPPLRAPRVVIDASSYFCVASATTAITVALVYVPEQQ